MTRTTNRRAVLGAALAVGALGGTAALSSAASGAIAASEPYEDAALFALLTEARAIDALQNEVDAAETSAWDRMIRPDRPIALRPRPDDQFLVRPGRGEFDESYISELRGLVESVEKLGPDTKINQAFVREFKTRGREIVDAWDSYRTDCDRAEEAAGLPAIDRRWDELHERRCRLWSRIVQTPAKTVEGMHAKIALALAVDSIEREDLAGGTLVDLLYSAAIDCAELCGQEART